MKVSDFLFDFLVIMVFLITIAGVSAVFIFVALARGASWDVAILLAILANYCAMDILKEHTEQIMTVLNKVVSIVEF